MLLAILYQQTVIILNLQLFQISKKLIVLLGLLVKP